MAGKTPTCPACGTKFSHDAEKASCKVCGIPDKWVETGRVAEWKRAMLRSYAPSKRAYKQALHQTTATQKARKKKHGRNICTQGDQNRNSRSPKSQYRKLRKAKLNAEG